MDASQDVRLPQRHVVPAHQSVVVGLGLSGMAICRHLKREGRDFMVVDTREAPPGLDAFLADFPGVPVRLGPLDGLVLDEAREVILSPGVDPHQACFEVPAGRIDPTTGEPCLVGEIALFRRTCRAPLAAITGANAKSTVTTLVGEMAREAGRRVAVGVTSVRRRWTCWYRNPRPISSCWSYPASSSRRPRGWGPTVRPS